MDKEIKKITEIFVDSISEAHSSDLPEIIKEFVKLLSEQKLIDRWREIENEIHKIWKEKFGASKITVVSAHPITEEMKNRIDQISKGADQYIRIDERLIGGAIVRIDDNRIDGSIAGKLQKLKITLSK